MAKVPWTARISGQAEPTGKGRILVPLKVDEAPDRPQTLVIQASRAEALIRQLQNAVQREKTLQAWAKGKGGEATPAV
ncbi:hypothetical protein [Micromonospora sp. CA-244673]|uniref:hypothetical protein n=1 Tax=Micromonospora sp. CA-244673 TaxID=3239958 RepID=UPI003D8E5549